MNRRESFMVDNIDRSAEWSARRGQLDRDAVQHTLAFVQRFRLPEEQAAAWSALGRAAASGMTATIGAVSTSVQLGAAAGRAATLPGTRGGRKW